MVSTTRSTSTLRPTTEAYPKRLAEHLQQQQEPFVLESYLHGYKKRKSLDFKGSFGCLCSNFPSNQKLSKVFTRKYSSRSIRRAKRVSDIASYFIRISIDFCNKFVSTNDIFRIKASDDRKFNDAGKGRKKSIKKATSMKESTRLSSIHEAAFESIKSNNRRELEELSSRLEVSFHRNWNSASLRESLTHNSRDKKNIIDPSNNTCSRHIGLKKALQQTKHLLFDCVIGSKKAAHLISTNELKKIISDSIRNRNNQSANGEEMISLLRSDLLRSNERQGNFEGYREEVVKEVGDKIMEEINYQIVQDLIDLYLCKTKELCRS